MSKRKLDVSHRRVERIIERALKEKGVDLEKDIFTESQFDEKGRILHIVYVWEKAQNG